MYEGRHVFPVLGGNKGLGVRLSREHLKRHNRLVFNKRFKMNVSIKLRSRIFQMFKIMKIMEYKQWNLKRKNKFLLKNTQYMWKTCQVLICTKFKINTYLGKTPSFGALKVAKGYFDAIPGEFCIFSIYRFCPIWAVQSVLWSFSASWRKTDLKTSTTPPKHKIFSLTFN